MIRKPNQLNAEVHKGSNMRAKIWHILLIFTFFLSLNGPAFAATINSEILEITADVITLEGDSSASVCSGFSKTYTLEVANGTTQEDTITFSTSGNTWVTLIEPLSLVLPAGKSEFISVIVQVPVTALAGDVDTAVITATGQMSALSDSATLITRAAIGQGWEDATSSPEGRGTYGHSLVYWDGKLFKIGGTGYVDDVRSDRPWVDIYDIDTDSWSQGADMNTGRSFIDCQAIDLTGSEPKIYCAGGYHTSAKSALFIYNINTDSWSTGEELPEPRYGYASVVHDDKYYVIGGIDTAAMSTVFVYDPDMDTWDTTKPPMAVSRSYFSAGLMGGKIVAAGGFDTASLSSVEIYDIALDAWSSAEPMPSTWSNAADGVIADRFLLMVGGGETGLTSGSNRGHLYDIEQDSWSLLPSFNHNVYGSEGAGDGSNFWVVSGRIYEDDVFSNSTYATKMVKCAGTCVPVTGVDFSWNPQSPLSGDLVTFTATVAEGSPPLNYLWDFGDGTIGNTETIEHTYITSGTFTVDLAVTNCYGSSTGYATHDVNVLGGPVISVDPGNLYSAQKPDETHDQLLEICNIGDSSLTWNIDEAAPQTFEVTDLSWVSALPTSGTLAAAECQEVVVSFDSTGLDNGEYDGSLKINSNDLTTPVIDVPLTMTVDDGKTTTEVYMPLIIR